jgi:amidophosphoribosyltransferase
MTEVIGCDSLAFISFDGMYRAMGEAGRNAEAPQYCDACFTGDYPIPLTDHEESGDGNDQLSLLAEMGKG